MAIASMAWDLKAWFGLLLAYRPLGLSIVRMEFKRFLNTFIKIPCLVVRTGRQIHYRPGWLQRQAQPRDSLFSIAKAVQLSVTGPSGQRPHWAVCEPAAPTKGDFTDENEKRTAGIETRGSVRLGRIPIRCHVGLSQPKGVLGSAK
jgi:hypothetical protein